MNDGPASSPSMKILMVAYACQPDRGSEPGNGWNWALSLARRGHVVTVLTRTEDAQTSRAKASALAELSLHFVAIAGRRRSRLPPQFAVYTDYLDWQKEARAYLASVSSKNDYEVFHHVTWGSLTFGTPLGEGTHPLIIGPIGGGQVAHRRMMSLFAGTALHKERARTAVVRSARHNWRARQAARSADVVWATNHDTAKMATKLGAKRVELMLADAVSRENISTTREKPKSPSVLWVGRFFPIKAPNLAMEVMLQVAHMVPGTSFRFIGDGPEYDKVSKFAYRSGIGEQVTFAGHVPWEQVQREYRDATCLLFTSLRESFGAQLLEGCAAGLPIVSIDMHGAADWLPNAASVRVPPSNPARLAELLAGAVAQVLSASESRWQDMSRAAVIFAENNTWEARSLRAESVYREMSEDYAKRARDETAARMQ